MECNENLTQNGKTFKDIFKYYKRKNVPLDFSDVYDFNQYGQCDKPTHFQDKVNQFHILKNDKQINWESSFGMADPRNWKVFTFNQKPGLIYIKNPFRAYGQRYWISRCLKDFTKRPNILNIHAHDTLSEGDDWWEFCQREKDTEAGRAVLEKLRWATLGYHHNWDTKEYSDDLRGDFPKDLNILCQEVGKVLGFVDFKAEAAIINMYHKDSCLNGHTDHSEVNLGAPLFSFSFGQSAIFLIGGRTLDSQPMPLLLESGDIIVMSKEARLCYHGVPRIVQTSNNSWSIGGDEEVPVCSTVLENELMLKISNTDFWEPFESYVSKSRINMNIRQVLFSGQTKLSKED